MELTRLFEELTDAARKIGIAVRSEPFAAAFPDGRSLRGGLCTVRGQRVIVVDATAPLPDRIAVVASSLAKVDLEGVDLAPIVRATIGAHSRTAAPVEASRAARPLARTKKRE